MERITSKVNKDARENARIDRERNTNPASSDPGMDDFDWGAKDNSGGGGSMNDPFGSNDPFKSSDPFASNSNPFGPPSGSDPFGPPSGSDPFGSNPFGSPSGSDPFGGGWGNNNWGAQSDPFGAPQNNQNQKKDIEDTFFEGLGKAFKATVTLTSELTKSFKTFGTDSRMGFGRSMIIAGGVVSTIGVVLMFLHFGNGLGLSMLVGGLLSVGAGVPTFMFAYDKFSKEGLGGPPEPAFPAEQEKPFEQQDDFSSDFGNDFFSDNQNDPFADSSDSTSEDEEYDEDEPFTFDDDDDEDDPFDFDDEDDDVDFSVLNVTDPETIQSNMDNSLAKLDNQQLNGMVTRQYLYEIMTNAMMNVKSDFDAVRYIEDDSEEFDSWDSIVQDSAKVLSTKQDAEMPYLHSVEERIFYYHLEIERVNWLKNIDAFVKEIVSIVQYNKSTGKLDENIYGIGNTVGDKIYIKIMKGDNAMVTIKDTYSKVESEILNTKNFMPVVLGLDVEGDVVWQDFKDINSILVTGMPRSGKTWFVLAVLLQMSMYLKPSELNFHILDPKAEISDFRFLDIPHIRKFVTTDATIVDELRHIVKVEGPRRKKIIGDAGFVNIWDYKKKNPDTDLPLLYVVIDEVITLAERMDDTTKDEFQALLLELVSQLPALGIRIFMIPHLVKDNILKKSITDLIPCRISVRGDAEHIEKSVGVKKFPHSLKHQGDMAVRFNNDQPKFVHSAIVANSNELTQNMFEYARKVWLKIEPEAYKGSILEQKETSAKVAKFQNNISVNTDATNFEDKTKVTPNSDFSDYSPRYKNDINIEVPEYQSSDSPKVQQTQESRKGKLTSNEIADLLKSAKEDVVNTSQDTSSQGKTKDKNDIDIWSGI